ncbi:hypothetical protein MBLNU230_g8659t1 [Neophaeotheca triangularis]
MEDVTNTTSTAYSFDLAERTSSTSDRVTSTALGMPSSAALTELPIPPESGPPSAISIHPSPTLSASPASSTPAATCNIAAPLAIVCPASNGTLYTPAGRCEGGEESYTIVCGVDFQGEEYQAVSNVLSMEDCVDYCQADTSCVAVAFDVSTNYCYQKSGMSMGNSWLSPNIILAFRESTHDESNVQTLETPVSSVFSDTTPQISIDGLPGSTPDPTTLTDTTTNARDSGGVSSTFSARSTVYTGVTNAITSIPSNVGSAVSPIAQASTLPAPSTSQSASAEPAYTCPAVDGQTVGDQYRNEFIIHCYGDAVDNALGEGRKLKSRAIENYYVTFEVTTSWNECFNICQNNPSPTGLCNSFTYVGSENGNGPGTCYLKDGTSQRFVENMDAVTHIAAIKRAYYFEEASLSTRSANTQASSSISQNDVSTAFTTPGPTLTGVVTTPDSINSSQDDSPSQRSASEPTSTSSATSSAVLYSEGTSSTSPAASTPDALTSNESFPNPTNNNANPSDVGEVSTNTSMVELTGVIATPTSTLSTGESTSRSEPHFGRSQQARSPNVRNPARLLAPNVLPALGLSLRLKRNAHCRSSTQVVQGSDFSTWWDWTSVPNRAGMRFEQESDDNSFIALVIFPLSLGPEYGGSAVLWQSIPESGGLLYFANVRASIRNITPVPPGGTASRCQLLLTTDGEQTLAAGSLVQDSSSQDEYFQASGILPATASRIDLQVSCEGSTNLGFVVREISLFTYPSSGSKEQRRSVQVLQNTEFDNCTMEPWVLSFDSFDEGSTVSLPGEDATFLPPWSVLQFPADGNILELTVAPNPDWRYTRFVGQLAQTLRQTRAASTGQTYSLDAEVNITIPINDSPTSNWCRLRFRAETSIGAQEITTTELLIGDQSVSVKATGIFDQEPQGLFVDMDILARSVEITVAIDSIHLMLELPPVDTLDPSTPTAASSIPTSSIASSPSLSCATPTLEPAVPECPLADGTTYTGSDGSVWEIYCAQGVSGVNYEISTFEDTFEICIESCARAGSEACGGVEYADNGSRSCDFRPIGASRFSAPWVWNRVAIKRTSFGEPEPEEPVVPSSGGIEQLLNGDFAASSLDPWVAGPGTSQNNIVVSEGRAVMTFTPTNGRIEPLAFFQEVVPAAIDGQVWSFKANAYIDVTGAPSDAVCHASIFTENEILQSRLRYTAATTGLGEFTVEARGTLKYCATRLTLWAVCQAKTASTFSWDDIQLTLYPVEDSEPGTLEPVDSFPDVTSITDSFAPAETGSLASTDAISPEATSSSDSPTSSSFVAAESTEISSSSSELITSTSSVVASPTCVPAGAPPSSEQIVFNGDFSQHPWSLEGWEIAGGSGSSSTRLEDEQASICYGSALMTVTWENIELHIYGEPTCREPYLIPEFPTSLNTCVPAGSAPIRSQIVSNGGFERGLESWLVTESSSSTMNNYRSRQTVTAEGGQA